SPPTRHTARRQTHEGPRTRCLLPDARRPADLAREIPRARVKAASALLDRNVVALAVTGVDLPRTADPALRDVPLFPPGRDPARQPAEGEAHGEVHGREAERPVDQAGGEVDVRVRLAPDDVLVGQRALFQPDGHIEEFDDLAELVED